MDHHIPLITTLAAGFGLALVLGLLMARLKVPALVGYLLAGILIGPGTPGFVADVPIAAQLSEIGVMLLMFGVGLHFSWGDLLAVKRIAIPGAVGQMSLATLLGMGVGWLWGWPWAEALVFGISLSCASTVVLLKALESRGILDSPNGRIAVGWLVVEDLVTVLILVLLPPFAGILSGSGDATETGSLWMAILGTLLEVAAFIVLMMGVGRRVIPWLLMQVASTGSRELFTLAIIATAIGIAFGAAALFKVSFALGAFFAGMVMRESEFSHRAATESLPLRDAFSVLFFVAVGMLFQPSILLEQPLQVLAVVAIIVVGKALGAFLIVVLFRHPMETALTVAASLAQIGEFSFILGGLGQSLGLLSLEAMSLILAGALCSIALNPLLFAGVAPLQRCLGQRFRWARQGVSWDDPLAVLPEATERHYLQGQVVLVGYGRVGQRIARQLKANGVPFVVVERQSALVEALREEGLVAVAGDGTEAGVLIQAHIAHAALLVIAIPETTEMLPMVDIARTLSPGVEVVLRCHGEAESQLLAQDVEATVFFGEAELAKGMASHIVARYTAPKTT